jgi:hypothetical protein
VSPADQIMFYGLFTMNVAVVGYDIAVLAMHAGS